MSAEVVTPVLLVALLVLAGIGVRYAALARREHLGARRLVAELAERMAGSDLTDLRNR